MYYILFVLYCKLGLCHLGDLIGILGAFNYDEAQLAWRKSQNALTTSGARYLFFFFMADSNFHDWQIDWIYWIYVFLFLFFYFYFLWKLFPTGKTHSVCAELFFFLKRLIMILKGKKNIYVKFCWIKREIKTF